MIFILLLNIWYLIKILKNLKEPYDEYDYDRENPNALVSGCNIAGTVYASDVGNTPGLGWIL